MNLFIMCVVHKRKMYSHYCIHTYLLRIKDLDRSKSNSGPPHIANTIRRTTIINARAPPTMPAILSMPRDAPRVLTKSSVFVVLLGS